MRLTIVFALALAIAAQEQRYSSKPAAVEARPTGVTRIKNAIDFTPDGVFLRKAAEDNWFVIQFGTWAKTHGEKAGARSMANELVLLETRFGDNLRRLAVRKHVALPEKVNDRDATSTDSDQAFIEQLLRRYDQEIVNFQSEAQGASDPDIKSFASDGLETLQRNRRLVEALQGNPRSPQ